MRAFRPHHQTGEHQPKTHDDCDQLAWMRGHSRTLEKILILCAAGLHVYREGDTRVSRSQASPSSVFQACDGPGQDSLTGALLCLGYLPALRHQLLFESNHSTRRHTGPPLPPLAHCSQDCVQLPVSAAAQSRSDRLRDAQVPEPFIATL